MEDTVAESRPPHTKKAYIRNTAPQEEQPQRREYVGILWAVLQCVHVRVDRRRVVLEEGVDLSHGGAKCGGVFWGWIRSPE